MEKLSSKIDISVLIKEFNFSLEEVILTVDEKMKQGGVIALLEFIFYWMSKIFCRYYMEIIIHRLKIPCCNASYWLPHGSYQRQLVTGIGKIKLTLHRMKCHCCEKTFIPFNIFFGMDKKNWSLDIEKTCLEMIVDQSYRRTSKHLKITSNINVGKNTIHKMVLQSDFKKQDLQIKTNLEVLAADGTGYKPHSDDSKKELKIAVGMDKNQRLIPVGAWVRSSWSQIGKEIKKANHKNKKLIFKPFANILLSDGEVNLIKGLKRLAYHQQRCQWHFVRDFKYTFVYQDKGDKDESKKITNELWDLVKKFDSPGELNTDEEKLKLLEQINQAEATLKDLEERLEKENFKAAAVYLRNARLALFNHLRVLIKSGTKVARVTSRIERFMREIARRMKRIAHNWSEAGAEIMARILLKIKLDPIGWANYWKEKMKITGNFQLEVKLGVPHN